MAQQQQQPIDMFDSVVECLQKLSILEHDEDASKKDVIDSMRTRLLIMVSRVSTNSLCTSQGPQGWHIARHVAESVLS